MLKEQPGHKRPLSISKAVIRNYKRRFTKLCMTWINFRKVCNLVQHSWVFKCPRMFGIGPNVIDLKGSSMPSWKICIPVTYPGGGAGDFHPKRLYPGGLFFPTFVHISINSINRGVAQCTNRIYAICDIIYDIKKNNEEHSVYHFLFLNDLKLFAKSEKQNNSLVQLFFTVPKTLVWHSGSPDILYIPSRGENQ